MAFEIIYPVNGRSRTELLTVLGKHTAKHSIVLQAISTIGIIIHLQEKFTPPAMRSCHFKVEEGS